MTSRIRTKHQLTVLMCEVLTAHAACPQPVIVTSGRHGTTLALMSRGLLRFTAGRRQTIPTESGWNTIRALLKADADELADSA